MLEIDKVIRNCYPDEAQYLNRRNQTENLMYDIWEEDGFRYYYILIHQDDTETYRNFRLKYEIVAPKKYKFEGEAVELDNTEDEFVDDEDF